jgi:hypothetical protein
MHNTLLLVDNNNNSAGVATFHLAWTEAVNTRSIFLHFSPPDRNHHFVGILQGVERRQIIAACPYKHHPLLPEAAAMIAVGMVPPPEFLEVDHPYFRLSHWRTSSSLLWQITFRTSFSACCCTHFLEARFSGAWFARPERPRQRSTVIIPTRKLCRWMGSVWPPWSALSRALVIS